MKFHRVEQGSADWHKLRLGIPTASEFHNLITPAKLEPSKSMRKYALRIALERLLNEPLTSDVTTQYMERGHTLEPDAVKVFEFQESMQTQPGGFFTTDDGKAGASPDRLVGDDGMIEVKCCGLLVNFCHLIDGWGADHRIQVQGQLLVSEREWCARVGYHPRLPLHVERSYRDETIIRKLREALVEFHDQVDEITERAKQLGVIEAAREVLTPEEQADGERGPRAPFLHTIINPFDDPTSNLMAG